MRVRVPPPAPFMNEDPQTDYEKALERYNLDCSMYGCWSPAAMIFLYKDGSRDKMCSYHADGRGHLKEEPIDYYLLET